uniref:Dynein light chain Tctex-type 1 n=1 Tax=Panagrolaimus sp. JU765 TaxID=591449 RepID=A0AC34QR88_9BILA
MTTTTGNSNPVKTDVKNEVKNELVIAPTFEEVNNLTKDVLESIIGQTSYQHMDSVKWNNQVVEGLTQRLVDLNRPYKYCVTCIVMQTGLGAGLNVSSTCYWDKSSDQSYNIRWENKSVLAIVTIFAISYARY